ncbi:hypothetical protein [Streptomyces sp. Isolate_45]|uniref:hypothetical protein n=1 Tax=Streptomyces sp. Isolate_45 TaxID=2950111 RepID=UPI002481CD54|nr:hypothetical protein [Streptomyces sp. Isolate_45]MDA5284316.1 hypothetical protein [Streptomyces sp. Isolate_45]
MRTGCCRRSFSRGDHIQVSHDVRTHGRCGGGTGRSRRAGFRRSIGDILSPAFGTNCANHKPPSHAAGATGTGTGTGGGGGGGDDDDDDNEIQNGLVNVDDVAIRILGSGSNTDIG